MTNNLLLQHRSKNVMYIKAPAHVAPPSTYVYIIVAQYINPYCGALDSATAYVARTYFFPALSPESESHIMDP